MNKIRNDRELGMVMYTVVYSKWISKKDLLCNTWNSVQCSMAAWIGGEFGEKWIFAYVWPSPFSVHLKLSQL